MTGPTPLELAFADICALDGTLADRLSAYAHKLEELNFPFAEAYDALVARLINGEIGATAPRVGDIMPSFMLPTQDGALCYLNDLLKQGPVVISFNRGHWCPFCRIELTSIARHHAAIAELGAQIVSILPDRQKFVQKLRHDTGDKLLILSDIDNGYALSLGLALWLGERLKELMRGRGFHLDQFHGNDGWFVPLPATFVVARNGTVVARHVDPEFRTRMEISEILTALRLAEGGG